jgi:hypothetical protein
MCPDIDWSFRPKYLPDQLNHYFDRINFPQKYRESPIVKKGPSINDNQAALSFLEVLQRYQLASVFFENLDLHYSAHHNISIDAQSVFEKIVDGNSDRGGYCMEKNTLLGTVLRSLGYNTTSVGGRVNEAVQPMSASKNWKGPKYQGWYGFNARHLSSLELNLVSCPWCSPTNHTTGTIWPILLPSVNRNTS